MDSIDEQQQQTPSGRFVAIDPAILAAAQTGSESIPSVIRAAICAGAAVAICWRSPAVSSYALGVLLAIASPALARALLTPLLAFLLRK